VKMKKRVLLISVLLIFTILALSGCSSGSLGGGIIPKDDFTPSVDDGPTSELYSRYQKYKQDASLAFDSVEAVSGDSFAVEQTDGGLKIVEYVGDDKVARIPESIDGKAVVAIGEGAFANKNMRAVYVPDSVTKIDAGAFSGCAGLVTLRLPRLFGDFIGYAFGADEYGENALSVPQSLETVILGAAVTEIPENAFSGSKTLSAVVLPETVSSIGKFAFFECADLVYVDLGEGVSRIGDYAFAECRNLYEIDCRNVSEIALGAFYNCSSLNKISVSIIGNADNAYFGYIFGAETMEYSADFVPASLRTVEIDGSCEMIPARAFAECDGITSIVLCDGLENIGVRAFYRCRSLGAVTLPSTVKSVGDDAFFGCDALSAVSINEGLSHLGMQAFFGCSALTGIELPMSLVEINPSTFYNCKSLVTVRLGGVKRIGKDAFGKCVSLTPISLDGIDVADGNEALGAIPAQKK